MSHKWGKVENTNKTELVVKNLGAYNLKNIKSKCEF